MDKIAIEIHEGNVGTPGWQYNNTSYEKGIDPDGMTKEYVRCSDTTTSGIVGKVIRIKLPGVR